MNLSFTPPIANKLRIHSLMYPIKINLKAIFIEIHKSYHQYMGTWQYYKYILLLILVLKYILQLYDWIFLNVTKDIYIFHNKGLKIGITCNAYLDQSLNSNNSFCIKGFYNFSWWLSITNSKQINMVIVSIVVVLAIQY